LTVDPDQDRVVPARSRGPAGLVAALGAAILLLAGAAPARTEEPLPVVTLIADSVASAVHFHSSAEAILREGIDLRLEIASCRRVGQESCPEATGGRPLNVIQLVRARGSALGPTVIVAVGYNDFPNEYAQEMEDALAAFKQAGVTHVLWSTLRAAQHPDLAINDAIQQVAAKHPEVTVLDWNLYSRSHPTWFAPDGLHLYGYGPRALAVFLHGQLLKLGIAVPTVAIATAALPAGRVGKPYAATVTARRGVPPYHWSATGLPRGLHLADGRITGKPAKAGSYNVTLQVVDAATTPASRRVVLLVR
jgi:hypothetical protein